jgi:hypothetical protein
MLGGDHAAVVARQRDQLLGAATGQEPARVAAMVAEPMTRVPA